MNFLTDPTNLILMAFALVSGLLLLRPKLLGGSGAAGISPLQMTQLINGKNALVLDVREPDEFAAGIITGSKNIPAAALTGRLAELSKHKTRPVIVVCQTGMRSGKAVVQLQKEGFSEVYNLSGGLNAWKQAGLPLVQPAPASGGKLAAATR